MAPTVVSTAPTNGLTTQASTTGGSVTLPTTAANDILILLAVNGGATTALTTGGTYSGGAWTSINSLTSTSLWGGVWWSRCTGDHNGQTVTTSTATNSTASAVAVVRGARVASSPLSGTGTSAGQTTTGMPAPAAFNTADADTLVCYTLNAVDNIAFAVTSPAGTTENIEVGSSGGTLDSLVGLATVPQATAGSTGSFAGTHAVAASKVAFAFALAPEPPGPIPDVAMAQMIAR